MEGRVTSEFVPQVLLEIAGETWTAVVDTGFNGDFELPTALKHRLPVEFVGPVETKLAGGQTIVENSYAVEIEFDGETVAVAVTFVDTDEVLIGTRVLQLHKLEIDFPARTLRLERAA